MAPREGMYGMWGGEWANKGCGGVEVIYIGTAQGSLARQLLLHVFCSMLRALACGWAIISQGMGMARI